MSEIENPRLLRLRGKLTKYQFTAEWRAGTSLVIPDALSRAPASDPTPEDEEAEAELSHHVRQTVVTMVNAVTDDGVRLMPIQTNPLEKVCTCWRPDGTIRSASAASDNPALQRRVPRRRRLVKTGMVSRAKIMIEKHK